MKRTALFLGAGASVPYGMPTTRGLMKKLGRSFPRRDLLGKYLDIEHILQILDQEARIAKSNAGIHHCKINQALRDNLDRTEGAKKTIEDLIRSHYDWDPQHDSTADGILKPLLKLAKSDEDHITIFTTNYDTVIERYAEKRDRNIDLINGFKPHPTAHAHVWKESFTPNNNMPIKAFLYKLHGSLSWQKIDVGGEESIAERPRESVSTLGTRDMYIRPSLDIKKEATQTQPYAAIRRKFSNLLASFDVCVAIGCSFRDEHIFKEFVKFIRHGGTLIAISPTASNDFLRALKRPLSDMTAKWGESSLYSMSYRPGERQRFYAVQQKLGEDDTDVIMDTINGIIAGSRSPHILGSIAEEAAG